MITARPGATFTAVLEGPAGIDEPGVKVLLGSTVVLERTTFGINEVEPGVYEVDLVAPATEDEYLLVWDDGADPPSIAIEELVVSLSAPVVPDGNAHPVVSLDDFRPPPRRDGKVWTNARIEQTEDFEAAPGSGDDPVWTPIDVLELDPADDDGAEPRLRSFTTASATVSPDGWLSIVWIDEDGNESRSPVMAVSGPRYRPTTRQIASILRARTYTDGGGEINLGEPVADFTDETRPTGDDVRKLIIPAACTDVAMQAGTVPGVYLDDARRVAALGAAKEIERGYLPEQAGDGDRTIYQTLRITFEQELKVLSRNIDTFLFATRPLL